jgi:protein-tyrosine phosphatase
MRLLFVCTGNICRSPTAAAVMERLVREAGLGERFEIDSAGTGEWQLGHPPDARAMAAASARGYGLSGLARQVGVADFERFDLIVGMDHHNMRELVRIAPDEAAAAKLRLLLGDADVPDPYSGGSAAFEYALDLIERGCRTLFAALTVAPPPP